MSRPPGRKRRDLARREAPDPGRRQVVVMALGLVAAVGFYLILGRSLDNSFDW